MLHLPSHTCPACNGPHRPIRAELPAAADLRPYFATYTPSKFPPAGTTTLSNSSAGVTGASGTICTVTVNRNGFWFAAFHGFWSGNASDGAVTTNLVVAGTGTVDSLTGDSAGTGSCSFSAGLSDNQARSMTNGQTVTVTWTMSGGTLTGTLYATFVPTAANPQ